MPRPHVNNIKKYVAPAEDFIKPHIYNDAEVAKMIPLLLDLQKKNPTSAKLTRKLASTCYKAGQFKESLYWFTQTYLRDRSDLDALWNMASIAHSLGMKNETTKYLEEYSKVDPNSTWGRIAKEFLLNHYSNNIADGFKNGISRVGYNEDSGDNNGPQILVVEGKETTVEDLATNYEPPQTKPPVIPGKDIKEAKKTKKKSSRHYKKHLKKTLNKAFIKNDSSLPIVKAKPL